jgi:hypothetical protein
MLVVGLNPAERLSINARSSGELGSLKVRKVGLPPLFRLKSSSHARF